MYKTIGQIKEANREAGHHFFDESTIRFFRSRIHGGVIHGRYFITSEDNFQSDARFFTPRIAHANGDVETLGGQKYFNVFHTHQEAKAQIEATFQSGKPVV